MERLRGAYLEAVEGFFGEVTSRIEHIEERLSVLERGSLAGGQMNSKVEEFIESRTVLESRLSYLEKDIAASSQRNVALVQCLAKEGFNIDEDAIETQMKRGHREHATLQLHPWKWKDEVAAVIECLSLRREQIEGLIHRRRFKAAQEHSEWGREGDQKGLHDVFKSCNNLEDLCRLEKKDRWRIAAASKSMWEVRRQRLIAVGGISMLDGNWRWLCELEAMDSSALSWEEVQPSMQTCRAGAGCAVVDGRLFICGGQDTGLDDRYTPTITHSVRSFAPFPAQGRWDFHRFLTHSRADAAVVGVDGILMVFGGSLGGGVAVRSGEQWNVRAGRHRNPWVPLPEMGEARMYHAAAVVQGRLWVFGGRGGVVKEQSLSSTECLDCAGAVDWATQPPMAHGRSECAACVLNDNIYLCGGRLDGQHQPSTLVERWSPSQRLWEQVQNMEIPRAAAGVAVMAGQLYVCGGHSGRETLRSVEKFDPNSGTWQAAPSMQVPRCHAAVAVLRV